ncbi:MAG TPA: nucleotide exchange factor GrpE [Bacillota bacterium]
MASQEEKADRPEAGPDLEAELKKAQAEATENYDRFLRARAELDNYQKRVQRDLAATIRRGKKDLLLNVLDVIDNLDRALETWREEGTAAADPHLAGIEMIHRQLMSALSAEGVAPIEAKGVPFDPTVHDAVAAWEKDGINTEIVTDEIRRGYTYEGEVLRPARVRVAKPRA